LRTIRRMNKSLQDKSLRTIRRMDKSLQDKMSRTLRRGQNVVDNSSHGQNVAWTNSRMDKSSQGQIVADKMLQYFMAQNFVHHGSVRLEG
jgi:hypothetical protein